jgi:hypothetical protein
MEIRRRVLDKAVARANAKLIGAIKLTPAEFEAAVKALA